MKLFRRRPRVTVISEWHDTITCPTCGSNIPYSGALLETSHPSRPTQYAAERDLTDIHAHAWAHQQETR